MWKVPSFNLESKKSFKNSPAVDSMQFWVGYGAALIVVGQLLAVLGVIIVVSVFIRKKLANRVKSGKKPERHGLPYPDLYYWHVVRNRQSLANKIKRIFRGGQEGM